MIEILCHMISIFGRTLMLAEEHIICNSRWCWWVRWTLSNSPTYYSGRRIDIDMQANNNQYYSSYCWHLSRSWVASRPPASQRSGRSNLRSHKMKIKNLIKVILRENCHCVPLNVKHISWYNSINNGHITLLNQSDLFYDI